MGRTLSYRHPELGWLKPSTTPGSIPPSAQVQRRQTKPNRQIMPIGVLALNQVDLPLTPPILELLLAGDGLLHRAKRFVADKAVNAVALRKAFHFAATMLPKAFHKIARDPDVERSLGFARKHVDARVSLDRHSTERDAKLTLKQVQGDERGKGNTLPHRHAELGYIKPSVNPISVFIRLQKDN